MPLHDSFAHFWIYNTRMSNLEFWPSLTQAWESTSESTSEPMHFVPETASGARWRLIKREDRVQVLWLEADGFAPSVLKIYRTPARLAWRTIGLASRANREFTVMMNAHRLGLPVVRPQYWLESRVMGGLKFSALALNAINGSDLETWLRKENGNPDRRQRMAEATGSLLGRFHRAGLFSGTARPRNLLLPDGDCDRICAIDLPYARFHDHDITGSDHAMADLGRALLVSDGQTAFGDEEREALILAYCDGDSDRARTLNSRLRLMTHKQWKRQRFLRRLTNLLSKDTSSPGRGGMYCPATGNFRPLDSKAVFLANFG